MNSQIYSQIPVEQRNPEMIAQLICNTLNNGVAVDQSVRSNQSMENFIENATLKSNLIYEEYQRMNSRPLNAAQRIRQNLEAKRDEAVYNTFKTYILPKIEAQASVNSMASVLTWSYPEFTQEQYSLVSGLYKDMLIKWVQNEGFAVEQYMGCDCGYNDNCQCGQDNGIVFRF